MATVKPGIATMWNVLKGKKLGTLRDWYVRTDVPGRSGWLIDLRFEDNCIFELVLDDPSLTDSQRVVEVARMVKSKVHEHDWVAKAASAYHV